MDLTDLGYGERQPQHLIRELGDVFVKSDYMTNTNIVTANGRVI
jgi:hypothetical protein